MQNGLILSPLLTLTKIGPKSLITSSIKDLEKDSKQNKRFRALKRKKNQFKHMQSLKISAEKVPSFSIKNNIY